MNWRQLLNEGRVEALPANKPELDDLRRLVARCLQDAALPLSADNKFGIAYSAARALATIAVRASGYRVRPYGGGHYNTFLALKAALGSSIDPLAAYLNLCREKRNELTYEASNVVTDTEAEELVVKTAELQRIVDAWIATTHSQLKP